MKCRRCMVTLCGAGLWLGTACQVAEPAADANDIVRSPLQTTLLFPINLPTNMVADTLSAIATGCMVPFYYPDEFGWSFMFISSAPLYGILAGSADTFAGRFFWEPTVFDQKSTAAEPVPVAPPQ